MPSANAPTPTKVSLSSPVATIILFASCLLSAILLRLPTITAPMSVDMAVYATIGSGMGEGRIPYVDLFDHKQPLIYPVYWLIDVVAPQSDAVARLAAAVAAALLAFLVVRAVAQRFALWRAVVVGALVLVVGVTRFVEGIDLNADHLLALTSGLAVLVPLTARSERRSLPFLGGVLLGLAILTKATAVVYALPALVALLWRDDRARRSPARTIGEFGVGATLPVLAASLVFAALGAFDDFFYANVTFNRDYVRLPGTGWDEVGWAVWDPLTVLFAVAGACGIARLIATRFKDVTTWVAILWLATALVSAKVSPKPFGHYFASAIAPAAFLVCLPLFDHVARLRKVVSPVVTLVLVALIAYPFARNVVATTDPSVGTGEFIGVDWVSVQEDAGRWVSENAEPGDAIFVVPGLPVVYWASNVEPATRYLYFHSVEEIEPDFHDRMIRDLEAEPPRWLISVVNPPEPYASFLSDHGYRKVEAVGSNVVGWLEIYARTTS